MTAHEIKVPQGMLEAAMEAVGDYPQDTLAMMQALEAALRWLSENPIVPTIERCNEIVDRWGLGHPLHPDPPVVWVMRGIEEGQRRMFRAPEPETEIAEER
jgi:hypothetical protein